MLSSMATGTLTAGGLELLKKSASYLLVDLQKRCKDYLENKKITAKNNEAADILYTKIIEIRKVKTILKRDKPIDLRTFYCIPYLIINKKRIRVDSLNDIPTKNNIVIEGIAGQGKSMLMRHLCSKEVEDSRSVPVFLELRNILDSESIKQCIIYYLETFGFTLTESNLENFINTRQLTLFLDGFDELSEKSEKRLFVEIEHICQKCPDLRIIISSRPNRGVQTSTKFSVLKLDDLMGDEYKSIINKIYDDHVDLIKEIEQNHENTKSLLKTPLLVVLLVLYHSKNSRLPPKLSDYYESILEYHHHIHDDNKPTFHRTRLCKISQTDFRGIFTSLCFETIKKNSEKLDIKTIRELVKAAQDQTGKAFDIDEFIKDVVEITCLLLKEGEDYSFIHESIKEYFAAAYVISRPDSIRKTFYTALLNKQKEGKQCGEWLVIARYLEDIDKFCYYKYYLLPQVKHLLISKTINQKAPAIRKEHIARFFKDSSLEIDYDTRINTYTRILFRFPPFDMSSAVRNKISQHFSIIIRSNEFTQFLKDSFTPQSKPVKRKFKVLDYIQIPNIQKELAKCTELFIKEKHSLAIQADSFIISQENHDPIKI